MIKNLLLLTLTTLLITATALAELPVYPGARMIELKASPNLQKMEIDKGGPSISVERKTLNYIVPANTTFEDIRRFYSKELQKIGYIERTGGSGLGETTKTAAYQTRDGIKNVSISLGNNPVNTNELMLSVSESVNRLY